MPREVSQELGHLKPFAGLVVGGISLDIVGAGLMAIGIANTGTASVGDGYDLTFLVWLGAILGAAGIVLFLMGLNNLLNGLFTTMASIVYRPD